MCTFKFFILITIAYALIPQSAWAQNQPRYGRQPPRLKQIAARLPSDSSSVRNEVAPTSVQSNQWSSSEPTSYQNANGLSENATSIAPKSGYTWQGQPGISASQVESTPVYGGGNSAASSSSAMTQTDVDAARRAILSGDFFRWHGTQSSLSRNR
jgi:hypothetical protein